MSNTKRQQQPYQPQQRYYGNYPQQYALEAAYTQYGHAPWQAAPPQQKYYQQAQQYPSADPCAYANNTLLPAASSPYLQHNQYQPAPSYYPQSQPYAASLNAVAYSNQAAYSRGENLAAENAAQGNASPSQLSTSMLSNSHSPRPSTGRSLLNAFVFATQGTSPSLESHVAHLSLGASAASLPTKPTSVASSTSASRPNSGMAYRSQLRPLSTTTYAAQSTMVAGETRSDISLRYPPLPAVPERPATPPALHSKSEAGPGSNADSSNAATNEATSDKEVHEYVSKLCSVIDIFEQRDDLLRLRTEAVGFQPKQAYQAWRIEEPSNTDPAAAEDASANPVLGVRLLQRLDKLQRENEELGRLLSSGANLDPQVALPSSQVEELRKEVQECHQLIDAMDKALSSAEARAAAAESALEVACRNNSTSILAAAAVDGEANKSPPMTRAGSAGRRGSKAATGTTNSAPGGGKGGQAQQRNKPSTAVNAAESTKDAPTVAGNVSGGTGKNKQRPKDSTSTRATRSDTAKPASAAAKSK
ncbi:uncharacterized protein UBRO_02283 [Ustilago bromivora]|uniref:Uncharacterized protein n=1 Tax=Ustilago bromivora TaxID=307758 RepID=A0A1K0GM72_9BASI|nr:uncharacterized protein UBRO_02283 [Ustilago bromivora]SYW82372.1 uncharacterized protein UBRO2_04494 [Ustilago bromivora]